jgi:hypothetical protein
LGLRQTHQREGKNSPRSGQKSEEKSSELFAEKLGSREVKKASHFFNYATKQTKIKKQKKPVKILEGF